MRASLLLPLPVALLSLAACNAPPAAPEIVINPGEPRTDADLQVVFLALTTDDNKDEVTHTFRWFESGTLRSDLTTDTVPAADTDKGETWKVVVTPNDGEVDGEPAEAEVVILDTAPVASVTLAPQSPATDEDLVATATAEDLDGDEVSFTYAWTRDGEALDWTEATVPASQTAHGETWEVTVTPTDGELAGEPVSASVTVGNTLPTVERVELGPVPATEDSLLVATAFGVEDLDDDAVTLSYTWFVNDTEVQSGEGDTLTGALFAKHDLVRVEVTPADAYGNGASVESDDLLVDNSVPSGASVVVASSSPDGAAYETSTLSCAPSGFADADGDTEGWTYAWQVDGATVSTSASIDGSLFSKGSVVTCVATPFDGEASGAPLTASAVRVANSLPTLASATLSSRAPTESDTLSVTLGAVADADGDTVTYAYDWTVNGGLVATSSTLTSSRWHKGDTIAVTVTPFDGTDTGASVTSASAIAVNSAPEVRSVSLTPSSLYTNDTLTATVTSSDADGDTVALSYQWYVNGVPRGADASSLSGATWFDKGDVVTVTVTPNDGDDAGSAVTSSSVTVRNSAPSAPVVTLDPADPVAGDTLVCNVDTDAVDPDGDAVDYNFSWTQDGVAFTSAGTTYERGDTVAGTNVQDGEAWVCSVVAGDGAATGSSVRDSVTVGGACGDESYEAEVRALGAVAYWGLDETSGVFVDVIGGHDGTLVGSASRGVTGLMDGGLGVDFGGTGHISVPYAAALNTASQTVVLWARVDATTGSWRSPFTNRGSGLSGTTIYASNVDDWEFGWANGTAYWSGVTDAASTGNVVLGQTKMVGFTLATTSSTVGTLFLDGVARGTSTSASFARNSTQPLRIGMGWTGSGTSYAFNGVVDGVALFDRALTAAEIASLYEAGHCP